MTTIVSAFISNINIKNDRSLINYIDYGIPLLKSKIPKIIFVDEIVYTKIKEYENEITKIIQIKKEDIYLYNYIHLLENFKLNSTDLKKDILEYIFIQNNKTEWIINN